MPHHPDPNRVMSFPEYGITVTPYEQAVDALASAVLAAGYPSDVQRRRKVVAACRHIGIDYIEAVARLCEHTGATPETARWKIVEYIGAQIGEMQAMGAHSREWVGQSGLPTDAWGNELEPDTTDRED